MKFYIPSTLYLGMEYGSNISNLSWVDFLPSNGTFMRYNLIITGFWTAHALLGLLGKRDADVGPAGPVFFGRSDLHFGSSSEVKHGFCWW